MSPVRPKVTVVGRRLAPSDHEVRDFLTRTAQPYDWLEAGSPAAEDLLLVRGAAGSRGGGVHGPFVIDVDGGDQVRAPVVIAAPGMVWRRLDVEGIDELLGYGAYYGAGRSEAAQCGGDPVVVVGAGNSAGQ